MLVDTAGVECQHVGSDELDGGGGLMATSKSVTADVIALLLFFHGKECPLE
jgi:hypothetical protein